MNLIASGFADKIFVKIIYHLLTRLDVDFVQYYFDSPNEIAQRVRARGQYYVDIQAGNYDCDWNAILPLDEQLIESMSACEQVVLRMLDRNDIWTPLTYAQRKALYLKHLRYWNDVIEKEKIDLGLFSGVPHGVFDYVAYALCKHKNIPVLFFACPSLLTDVVFIAESWEEPALELDTCYKRLVAEGALIGADTLTLSPKFEEHYRAQTRIESDPPMPYHMSQAWFDNNKIPGSWGILAKRIKFILWAPVALLKKMSNPLFWVRKISIEITQRKQRDTVRNTARYYDAHVTEVDLSRKFIYAPLQQQPEMTTSPMAGAYVDQHLIIQQLAACVPEDVLIYVKEHPYQDWGGVVGRETDDYRQMLALRNVRFVSKSFNTYRLIDNCIAVATATGTAGWEGLFRGKPLLMFGHHIYQYAPGVFAMHTVEDCIKAISAILAGAKPTLAEMRLYLKAMEEVAIIGYTDSVRRQITVISDEDNVANLADALIARIKKFGLS
jgi:hypothetical protein